MAGIVADAKNAARLGLAREAVMVNDLLNLARMERATVRGYRNQQLPADSALPEDEEMQIGDTTIHLNMPAEQSAAAPNVPTGGAGATGAISTSGRIAAAAALAAGALGLGATAPAALSTIKAFSAASAAVHVFWDGTEIQPGQTDAATEKE